MGLVLYYGCNPQLEILLAHRPCTLLAPGLRGMYKSVLFKRTMHADPRRLRLHRLAVDYLRCSMPIVTQERLVWWW